MVTLANHYCFSDYCYITIALLLLVLVLLQILTFTTTIVIITVNYCHDSYTCCYYGSGFMWRASQKGSYLGREGSFKTRLIWCHIGGLQGYARLRSSM